MKREDLKNLEIETPLTDTQIDAVMKSYGQSVQTDKELQKQVESLTTERDSLKTQLETRDTDIKTLKKANSDNEEVAAQLKELQTKYKTDTDALNQKLSDQDLANSIKDEWVKSGARHPEDFEKFLDRSVIKKQEDGTLFGFNDQLVKLKESRPELFQGAPKQSYNPQAGNPVGPQSLQQALQNPKTNWDDFLKQQQQQ